MITIHDFSHPQTNESKKQLLTHLNFQDMLGEYYTYYNENDRKVDLYGKTVQVSSHQFPNVYKILEEIKAETNCEIPEVFVFEDFFYSADGQGIEYKWIEVSASTITDFTEKELKFLLARAICEVNFDYAYYETMINISNSVLARVPTGILSNPQENLYNQWFRLANYSCDNFAFMVTRDIEACSRAIIKTVLNSQYLAGNMDIKAYMDQSKRINDLDHQVTNLSKYNELFPYGPNRVKNLFSYASSPRFYNYIRRMKD